MAGLPTVAAVSLVAAGCFGASAVIEQRKAAQAPVEATLQLELLWHLAGQPLWWLAIVIDLGGYGFQAWALTVGSVAFVQPIIVLSLPFALIIGHVAGSHRLRASDLGWSIAFTAALTCFLVVGNPTAGVAARSFGAWTLPLVVVAVLAVGCVAIGGSRDHTTRALSLGVAAGMLFGVASVLTKSVTTRLTTDPLSLLGRWETYALAVTAVAAVWLMSSAFQAGDLRASLPAITLAEPAVAVVLGVVLLHERLDVAGTSAAVVVAVSIPVMVFVAVVLARAAAVPRSDPALVAR